ncbi:MAG TPA: hypothetical protein VI277_01085 [Candidatus Limnocylindria bacterium]
MATPNCVDDVPFGIDVRMRLGWFRPTRINDLMGKAGAADPCWTAFDERPGTGHDPFDLVGGAWASPGPIQRIGIRDGTGLVRSVMWGRENPRLDRAVQVTALGPRELAVTWRGASCDSNTTVAVDGTADAVRITIERGRAGGCSGNNVVYDAILELEAATPVESVVINLEPESRGTP